MRSVTSYNTEGGRKYLAFLDSPDGQVQQKILYEAFYNALGPRKQQKILDVACGPGWLAARLQHVYPDVHACDGSEFFVEHAKETYENLDVQVADLAEPLPYQDGEFDTVIFSMAAQDIEDQSTAYGHINRVLKPGGRLLVAIPNPYYAFPVGRWKRGVAGFFLGQRPRLKLKPYHWVKKGARTYIFQEAITSHFYTMAEHINNALASGFVLQKFHDLEARHDDPGMGVKYQIHRFPIILFLEFKKSS